MAIHFTVAICTYNGADRLPQVLDRLQNQTDTNHIHWEILVVDNNSSDNTLAVVQRYQAVWSKPWRLRYCCESEQGLAIARQRAITEARGNWVGFLDDDNVPALDWVAQAYTFGQAHPKVGAYGSRIYGDFEVAPPQNFQKLAPFLAITNRGSVAMRYEPHKKVLPPGAGLVVQRQVWLDHVPQRCFLQGRVSGPKLPGEDLEALLHIQRSGWEVWYNPAMQVAHQIPHWRLEKSYLLKLFRGIGLSRYHTRMLSVKPWQGPLIFPLYVANDLRKITTHLVRHRQRVRQDLILACELQLMLGSLYSPIHIWQAHLQRRPQSASVTSRAVTSRAVSTQTGSTQAVTLAAKQ